MATYGKPMPMRIQARPNSEAEQAYFRDSALPGKHWPAPRAIAPGISPAPVEDMIYHGGKTVARMEFQNIYLGGKNAWNANDVASIDDAIKRAMQHAGMNHVMQQYFPGAQLQCDMRDSFIADGNKPDLMKENDVRDRMIELLARLGDKDLDTCLFNLLLPAGTVLELDGLSSLQGLGGYHGSLHLAHGGRSITLYYSANAFSEFLADGRENGIVSFDRSWKSVVGTLYHEINEFRTDPDVQDAIDKADNDFLGWSSRRGREVGDQPIFQAGSDHLNRVFKEISDPPRTVHLPVQFLYSNAVHGAEGPIAQPHAGAATNGAAAGSASPAASSHGRSNRGLVAGALPGVPFGRFGNMLPRKPARRVPEEALRDLAQAMIKEDAGAPIVAREPVDENPAIPAGYTYFGQFVDHDITFDPTPFATAERDTQALTDFRSPALDLDSLYGRGPDDQPYLYEPGSGLLRVGSAPGNGQAAVGTANDLFRLDDGTPLLGDKRNDENKIVSQLHGVFIAFHNKVMDPKNEQLLAHFGFDPARPDGRFRAAANLVRWHYQWIVLHDYLERITQPGTVSEVLNPGGTPRLSHYLQAEAKYPYMPIEFSGAAFRFGHSQVRPSYSLNKIVLAPKLQGDAGDPLKGRIPTFARPVPGDGNVQNLNGFPGTLALLWGIDWAFFFDGLPQPPSTDLRLNGLQMQLPQPSYRIDALLVSPLRDLPEFFQKTDSSPGSLVGHLAFRNLLRGQHLGLPSGQHAAEALDIEPLTDEVLWEAGSRLLDRTHLDNELKDALDQTRQQRAAVREKWVDKHGAFARNTPLWYYILREAEYYGVEREPDDEAIGFGGQHLGPVGSRIVAETLIGLLWHDKHSFLHAHRPFAPLPAITGSGPFTLDKLIAFALG